MRRMRREWVSKRLAVTSRRREHNGDEGRSVRVGEGGRGGLQETADGKHQQGRRESV